MVNKIFSTNFLMIMNKFHFKFLNYKTYRVLSVIYAVPLSLIMYPKKHSLYSHLISIHSTPSFLSYTRKFFAFFNNSMVVLKNFFMLFSQLASGCLKNNIIIPDFTNHIPTLSTLPCFKITSPLLLHYFTITNLFVVKKINVVLMRF